MAAFLISFWLHPERVRQLFTFYTSAPDCYGYQQVAAHRAVHGRHHLHSCWVVFS